MSKFTKLNRNYSSPLEMIGMSLFGGKLYQYFYPSDYLHYIHYSSIKASDNMTVLGAFQPFEDMGKDLSNTFNSYKTGRHAAKEFLQPMRGLGNILRGITIISLAAIAGYTTREPLIPPAHLVNKA